MKPKADSLKRINKIGKLLARLTKKKAGERRHKLLISEMERGHHYRSHGHWKDNEGILWTTLCPQIKVDETDKFLERHNLLKVTKEEI